MRDPVRFDDCSTQGRPNPRPCLWCAKTFQARRINDDYCSPTCARDYNNWRRAEGAKLFDFMIDFRGQRKKGSFTNLCQVADMALTNQRDRWRTYRIARGEIQEKKK